MSLECVWDSRGGWTALAGPSCAFKIGLPEKEESQNFSAHLSLRPYFPYAIFLSLDADWCAFVLNLDCKVVFC